jgi:hypothetical protein
MASIEPQIAAQRFPRRMAEGSLKVVREILQAYADRAIFLGFSEFKTARGLPAFRFIWLIQHQMELCVDTETHVLRFSRLLPGVPASSTMYVELKRFLHERHDTDLPAHRRIDRRRAEVLCSNRGGNVSISLRVKNNHYAYGVNRIVNLVHELFVYLRDAWPDYLVENFDVPQE